MFTCFSSGAKMASQGVSVVAVVLSFAVTGCGELTTPQLVSTLPAVTVEPGTAKTLYLDRYFDDASNLTFRAVSADTLVAVASVTGLRLLIEGRRKGVTQVMLEAFRGSLGRHERVAVTVPNRPPVVRGGAGVVPDMESFTGVEKSRNVAQFFEDLDGDSLTYEAESSDPDVATVRVEGPLVWIRGQGAGRAFVGVKATDGEAASSPVTITATIVKTGFPIQVEYIGEVPSSMRLEIQAAAEKWMRVLSATALEVQVLGEDEEPCGDFAPSKSADISTAGIIVYVKVDELDGPGGMSAGTGWCRWRRGGAVVSIPQLPRAGDLPFVGAQVYDVADLDHDSNKDLYIIALHEFGHSLGIGWSWEIKGGGEDPYFSGPRSVSAFDAAGGVGYQGNKVPLQRISAFHWREQVFAGELMEPVPRGDATLSSVTLSALADFGYTVDFEHADPFDISLPASFAEPLGDLPNGIIEFAPDGGWKVLHPRRITASDPAGGVLRSGSGRPVPWY
jgi:hypothetical protein